MAAFRESPQAKVLTNPQYLKLWIGQMISSLGDMVAYMGLAFLILYRLGGTAVDVGKMTIAASIPTLLIGPIAGVFVDRLSRKRVAIVADVVRGLIYLAMPFVTSLTLVYVGVFCASVMSRFFYPAKSALVPQLVAPNELMVAMGLNQTSGAILAILGPAVGGALAAAFGPSVTLYLNAASFFVSGLLIALIRVNEASHAAPAAGRALAAIGSELAAGLRFIAQSRAVAFITGSFGALMLFVGGMNVLFLPYLKDTLGFTIRQIGLTESAQAVGGVVGAVLVTAIATRFRPRSLIFGSVVGIGLTMALIACARGLWQMFSLAVLLGVLLSAMNVPFNAELVKIIPNQLRGRVFGAFGSATEGCGLLSMAIMPFVAVRLGLPTVMLGAGAAIAFLGLVSLLLAPRLMVDAPPTVTVGETTANG